jgi:hypothetical protein
MVKRPLIAICTCHRFQNRTDMVRATWLKDITQLEYRFFFGKGGNRTPEPDEVFLDVDDSYEGLSWKTRAIMNWALNNGYDAVFKCDDDTFVFPERLAKALPRTPYEGRVNLSNKALAPNGWCSGFAYWLSSQALGIIADAPEPKHKAEDLWVGITLNKHGIAPVKQSGFIVMSVINQALWSHYKPQIIAACEFKDGALIEFDRIIKSTEPYIPNNSLIKRDLRTGKRVMRFGDILRRGQ